VTIEQLKTHVLDCISEACRKAFGQAPEGLEIDFPPDLKLGNFAAGCFPLSKKLRKSPAEIAKTIAAAVSADEVIESATAAGPYINFKLANHVFFGSTIESILATGDRYGDLPLEHNKRVMVEYLSPNTNKPLHLGHLRNAALGIAVSRLLEATGHRVVTSILINDRGVHICKSMLAWQRFGNGASPGSQGVKGDHFVGKWYVRYAIESEKDPFLEQNIQEMLKKWETGDPATLALWKKMNQWVYEGFAETYRRFGMQFDVFYYESDTYKLGKDVIAEGLKKGVFAKDERGNIVYHLPEAQFGTEKGGASKKVTVLRPDGTSLYISQDIGTAILKVTEHNLDSSVYVVGSEQEHHFKCLFSILESLGYAWAPNCYHLSYGMVYLPEGKMKSREGKVVDADDLIAGMVELAEEEIRKRDPERKLSDAEVQHRAAVIGTGAIKYYLLRVRPAQSINFDPAESISFDGFTGPYCQYAYARIFGILEKAGQRGVEGHRVDFALLGNIEELLLLKMLIQFPEEVASGVAEYNPSRVAVHVFNTAKAFNQFYNQHAVLQAESAELTAARLALIKATAVVLKRGLNLLGMDVLENM
jgi:arginyl-tRNA synthetase